MGVRSGVGERKHASGQIKVMLYATASGLAQEGGNGVHSEDTFRKLL